MILKQIKCTDRLPSSGDIIIFENLRPDNYKIIKGKFLKGNTLLDSDISYDYGYIKGVTSLDKYWVWYETVNN